MKKLFLLFILFNTSLNAQNYLESSFNDGEIPLNTKSIGYTIHFKNTSDTEVSLISISDTLNPKLFNLNSINGATGQLPCKMTVCPNGLIVFLFTDVNLQNFPFQSESQITFTVLLQENLAVGTKINNRAVIAMNSDAPFITNNTLQILQQNNSVQNINNQTLISKVYPNPTHSDASLEINIDNTSSKIVVSVIDLLGKEVLAPISVANIGENNRINISSSALNEGLYFVKVSNGTSFENIPFVVHD